MLRARSEEHTSELQSRQYLVCRLLLEKKNAFAARRWYSTAPRPRVGMSRLSTPRQEALAVATLWACFFTSEKMSFDIAGRKGFSSWGYLSWLQVNSARIRRDSLHRRLGRPARSP